MNEIQYPDKLEDLAETPNKYGMPTFEQYVQNREKYNGRYDEVITSVDNGDKLTGCRQKYYVDNYRVESLEQAERIASDMGLNLHHDFIIDPQFQDDDGIYLKVTFRPKAEIERRGSW